MKRVLAAKPPLVARKRFYLANGKIDEEGCLVCPWHQSVYDPVTGRMVVGPQAGFEKVPGLDTAFKLLTKLWPLRRAKVFERQGKVYLRS